MSRLLLGLTFVATATATIAFRLLWTLLAEPTTMATAIASGSVQTILSALLGTR